MNVKKLVYLCISIATLIVSLVFSVDGASVTAKFDANKAEIVTETTQLSDIIDCLPSSSYYYGSEEGVSENFKSVTMVEESKLEITNQVGMLPAGYRLNRTLSIYFTEEGAYYQSQGVQTERKQTIDGCFDIQLLFDIEIYISNKKVFVKYNRYETTAQAGYVFEEMQQMMFDTIKKNYGKWIDLSCEVVEMDEENPDAYENMTEEQQEEFAVQYITSMVSLEMISQLITTNDQNIESLKGLGTFIGTNPDAFTVNNNSFDLLEDYSDAFANYMGGFKGRFNINLQTPATPRMYFQGSLTMNNKVYANMTYKTTFKNIGNTYVNAPESIKFNISDFMGEYIQKLLTNMQEEN